MLHSLQTTEQIGIQINVVAFLLAIITNLYFLVRYHRRDPLRSVLYALAIILSGWMVYGYWQIVTTDAGATAVFRNIQPGWATLAIAVPIAIHTIITASPSEQMLAEIQRLEDKVRGSQSATNTWQGVTAGYKEREAKWAGEKDRLIADATEIRKALERERDILAETRRQAGIIFDAKMRAEETIAKQEDAIDALKRQIEVMETQLRQRGRDG